MEDADYIDSSDSDPPIPSGRPSTRLAPNGASTTSRLQPSSTGPKAPKARWELLQRSWDTVLETADGSLSQTIAQISESSKRRRLVASSSSATPLQRGIIRHLVIILDLSVAMSEKDLRPTRQLLCLRELKQFVPEYFDQNPISQLGLIVTRDGLAKTVCSLTGNPGEILSGLGSLFPPSTDPSGSPSLQNSLEVARGMLFHAPSHGTREVLVIWGALLSSDPGDVYKTIDSLVADRIRVSVVGLAAQVKVLSELVSRTTGGRQKGGGRNASVSTGERGGGYAVVLNEMHLRELVMGFTMPPVTLASTVREREVSSLLVMGFPSRISAASVTMADGANGIKGANGEEKDAVAAGAGATLCACHSAASASGYLCPRCWCKADTLPTECAGCGLTLILSTHLARSYHHLFPLTGWVEVDWDEVRALEAKGEARSGCYACLEPFPTTPSPRSARQGGDTRTAGANHANRPQQQVGASMRVGDSVGGQENSGPGGSGSTGSSESHRYKCTACDQHFCIECDLWAHEVGFNCPGCMSLPQKPDEVEAPSDGVEAMVIDR